ncbi:N/A [soil metagenome]
MFLHYRIFIFCVAILLTACSGPAVKVQLLSANQLNPNAQGKSLPVQVRIYTLNSADVFKQASFKELWKHDKTTLGDSLIESKEFMLSPHTRGQICFTHNSNVHYVGIIAVYRRPKHNRWRVIEPIAETIMSLSKPIKVYFHNNVIQLNK